MSTIQNANSLLTSLSTTNHGGKRVISHAANQSVRPYSTNQEYLYAMREDLSEWLKGLYAVDIDVANFFKVLETGVLLCRHANNITTCADYIRKNNIQVPWKSALKFPTKMITFNQGRYVRASSFFARDNVANFIDWCRNELDISDAVMFETNDLVLKRNEKHVILCLLEVARRGSKFGVPAPVLIQMEEEIDEEIEMEKAAKEYNKPPPGPPKQKVTCDFKSLDEMVQYILGMCTCPSQFPMTRVSDGKYKVGDSENLIFMRILRQHVMVRVGGGWDTLEHYLNKHDPCRCLKHKSDRAVTPRTSRSQSTATSPRQQPQRQYQRSLTSAGTPLRSSAPPSSTRFAASGRMSRSTTNLSELVPHGKTPPKHRRSASQSRNSSTTSDTSSSDKRPSPSRHSHDVQRNVAKNSQSKKDRLSLQSNVFDRLSRPKSTPPIRGSTSIHQDDQLLVQRNKKGSHQVQRTSTPRTSRTENERSRTRSSDNGDLRSKSSVILSTSNRNEEQFSRAMTPRQRRSLQANQNQSSRPSTARSTGPRSKSMTRLTVSTDHGVLQAFEKESFDNRRSVQHNATKYPPRQASVDSSLDSQRLLSYTSSEDSEVALHMQAANEPEPKASRPPPSSYNSFSLPRPRKEKKEQYDRPTRIPTPVSFNMTLPTSRSLDFYQEKMPLEKSKRPTVVSDEIIQQITKAEQKKLAMNGNGQVNGGGPPSSPMDIRQPRTAIPFDKLNLLLNSGKFNFDNDDKSNGLTSPEIRVSQHLDSTSLHSSGYPDNGSQRNSKSTFAPIENRPKKDLQRQFAIFDEVFASTRSHHDIGSQPVKARGFEAPVNGEIKSHHPGHRGASDSNVNSPLPANLLKTSNNNFREPYWV